MRATFLMAFIAAIIMISAPAAKAERWHHFRNYGGYGYGYGMPRGFYGGGYPVNPYWNRWYGTRIYERPRVLYGPRVYRGWY